ncbi:hypothetical protein MFLO_05530 [Listeria floridensis FSL S10-1187]|uniref:Transcriptional regulator n=1 Tax=Listeria floridensis FSL S10-1187 TaxID=1265817 RepID=A0ABN0RGR3_9LIST|nr:HTH domain-containing protein [Listeria floridensis]EUJ33037.1 hypothetical protein MFLO_05530 [Listeria floridensis FSL S10-1187]
MADGFDKTSEDEKVRAVISQLAYYFDFSYETLALYGKVSVSELEQFMQNPEALPLEKRYVLGIRMLYLNFILKECYQDALA